MLEIKLQTGILKIEKNEELDKLVSYSSRINKKRGLFFVSKVTGKHLPTKPSLMYETYQKLANMIPPLDVPTLFIGFAEAATALGHGVFEAFDQDNSFYIHSSRFKTSKKVWFSFKETHSHAPNHIFYEPLDSNLKALSKNIKRIILIDDEITTGNTVSNIVNELRIVLPDVKDYLLLSILDWTSIECNKFKCLSLYKGRFIFDKKDIEIENNITSEPKKNKNLDSIIPYNFSRYGVQKLNLKIDTYVNIKNLINKKVLVLGTAEFMYPPFLLAHYLEKNGINTYYQATTRSPINIDGAIVSKLSFKDNYFENIDNFLYNVFDKNYDKIFICYETSSLPLEFDLVKQLKNKFSVEEIFFNV